MKVITFFINGFYVLFLITLIIIISLVAVVFHTVSNFRWYQTFDGTAKQYHRENNTGPERDAYTVQNTLLHTAVKSITFDELLMDNMNLSTMQALQLHYISLQMRIDPSK